LNHVFPIFAQVCRPLISSTMKTQVFAFVALAGQCTIVSAERRLRHLYSAQVLHANEKPALSLVSINEAENNFLHFLETAPEGGTAKMPPYEDFMPACLEHTKDLVHSMDHGYTDLQLQQNLEYECQRDKEFTTVEDGFDDHEACLKFANELVAARNKELKTGSDNGYTKFCEKFFVHKGGEKPTKEKKEKKDKKNKKEKKKKVEEREKDTQDTDSSEVDAVEKEVMEPSVAPAAAPVASPMASPPASPAASPMASPVASPGPGPAFEPAFAPAPFPAPGPTEFKGKCDLVYDAEYKRQMNMGRSNERAKKEAKAARYKCLGISTKAPKSEKGEIQWWAIGIVVGLVLAFVVAGGIVQYRNS